MPLTKNSYELEAKLEPAVKMTSSPTQNVSAITLEINVGTGVGKVWILNLSEISEQAVVSVAGPLNTSTLTFSLLARVVVVKVDCVDLACITTPSMVNS